MTRRQVITSAAASLNQMPAIVGLVRKLLDRPEDWVATRYWARAEDVLDYGGGRFDQLTQMLAKLGTRNWILDPYNREAGHNALVRQMLKIKPADIALCSNVLNAIKEPKVRQGVLREIRELTKDDGDIFFTVYEGDKSSRGRRTTKGWQAHRPTKSYLREIRKHFNEVHHHGKLIFASGVK